MLELSCLPELDFSQKSQAAIRPGIDEKKPQSRHSLSPNTLLGWDLPPLRIDWPLGVVHGHLPHGWCDYLGGRPGDGVLGNPEAVFYPETAAACQKTLVNRAWMVLYELNVGEKPT